MKLRYSKFQILTKRLYRNFFPVPKSPYTIGEIEDICSVELVPPKDLIQFFSRSINLLKKYKGNDIGDYLEFGVFNGASMSSMYKSAKQLEFNTMRFFGFDAFEGLPEGAEHEDDGVWQKGFYACSYEKMRECMQRKDINPDEIVWVKGWYNETLNKETADKYNLKNPGIVFIDCDTYSSSKSVLDFLAPLINQPAIICLDDWKLNDLDIKGMGEYKSFNEFIDSNPNFKIKEIKSYNRKSRSFLLLP